MHLTDCDLTGQLTSDDAEFSSETKEKKTKGEISYICLVLWGFQNSCANLRSSDRTSSRVGRAGLEALAWWNRGDWFPPGSGQELRSPTPAQEISISACRPNLLHSESSVNITLNLYLRVRQNHFVHHKSSSNTIFIFSETNSTRG